MADAERIARAFHERYEALAPEHSYKTREASAVPWEDVPQQNKNLMVAVVESLLERGTIALRVVERIAEWLCWEVLANEQGLEMPLPRVLLEPCVAVFLEPPYGWPDAEAARQHLLDTFPWEDE